MFGVEAMWAAKHGHSEAPGARIWDCVVSEGFDLRASLANIGA